MKHVLTLLMITLWVGAAAQAQEIPKSEYNFVVASTDISLKPGETQAVDFNIIRSKQYSKSKAQLGFSSSIPKGLTITYNETEGLIEKGKIKFQADSELQAGTYQIILKCTVNNKIKGAIVKVTVGNGGNKEAISSNN